jgi:hypothetical protein
VATRERNVSKSSASETHLIVMSDDLKQFKKRVRARHENFNARFNIGRALSSWSQEAPGCHGSRVRARPIRRTATPCLKCRSKAVDHNYSRNNFVFVEAFAIVTLFTILHLQASRARLNYDCTSLCFSLQAPGYRAVQMDAIAFIPSV